jgi:hypothetical protein
MNDLADFLQAELATVIERDLPTEVAALLVEGGGDDAPYARLLEHLSIYLDSQWATARAAARGAGSGSPRSSTGSRGCLACRSPSSSGCSVGRVVAELARTAEHVVGLDLQFGAVRRAAILDGEQLALQPAGHRSPVHHARVSAGDLAASRVTCCAAMRSISLIRGPTIGWSRSTCSIRSATTQLLTVMDALCVTGGELILASPYAWKSSVMADAERLGGSDPAAALRAILVDGTDLMTRYAIEDEAELPWTLRRDARSSLSYRVHYVRARKL